MSKTTVGMALAANRPQVPNGERTIKVSPWGIINGYIDGHHWIAFGIDFDPEATEAARAWVKGEAA